MIDEVVTWLWTIISGCFTLLALYGIVIAAAEDRDTRDEVRMQEARRAPNGVLILGLQQLTSARHLRWMHRYALVHQGAGLVIGVFSIMSIYYGPPEANTPTTQLQEARELVVLAVFMVLLLAVCAVQVRLILVTKSQRQARLDLRALELGETDELEALAKRVEEQLGEFRAESRRTDVLDARDKRQSNRGAAQDERGREQDQWRPPVDRPPADG